MNSEFRRSLTRTLNRDRCPATVCLMIAAFTLFVAENLTPGLMAWIFRWLMYDPTEWLHKPWTLLTGSLACIDVWGCLFGLIWLYFIGGSLERSIGTRTLLGLWAAVSVLIGLSLYVCEALTGHSGTLSLMIIVDALTVAWAMLNRGAVINFWGILPVSATFLAMLACIFTLITYHLPAGLFALSGSALCWAFVRYRWFLRSSGKGSRPGYGTVTRISGSRGPGSRGSGSRPGPRITEASHTPLDRLRSWRDARRFEKLLRDAEVDERTRGH